MKVISVCASLLFFGATCVSGIFEIRLPVGCPAAMNCTDITFCGLNGFISKTPVEIPTERELYRMPLSDCRDPLIGLDNGKCCRDPDYVDPWPSSTYRSVNIVNKVTPRNELLTETITKKGYCTSPAQRKYNTTPVGQQNGDANFKEFSWNILISKKSSNSKLCSGTLIGPNVVLTSASCVQFETSNDILLKGGAWKLESEVEPSRVQTRSAKTIIIHPNFNSETHDYDLAIIVTESDFKFGGLNDHISPICIDYENLSKNEHCVVLGWGDEVLKNNIKDSIIHYSNITVREKSSASSHLAKTDLDVALYDIGSGLSCSYDNINYYLKGVYLRKRETGFVEFTKPDFKWISHLFSVNFQLTKNIESSITIDRHLFGTFYKKTNGLYGECPYNAQRKFNTVPQHKLIGQANFKEFSWQIMVLKQSTKSLLCGATLIAPNAVLTSASCVVAEKPYDIVLKAGEWKLGNDIEPLKSQTQVASKILIHPKYNGQSHDSDLAVIVTEADFKFDSTFDHISPICIEFGDLIDEESCVVLGWGTEVLKYNIKDSIMNYANITGINKDYKSHPTSHLAETDLDPALLDIGSGLACTRDKINFYLKGVYVKVLATGYVQFFKVDYEWISSLFKSGFSIKQNGSRGAGLGIITGINASSVISNLNLGNFYGAFFKKGSTTFVSTFGTCPFPAIRRYNTVPKAELIGEANFKEFTWQVLVLKKSTNEILCGGTLIAPNVVLTSATCISSENSKDLALKAGEWKLENEEEPLKAQTLASKKTLINPKYKAGRAEFNLGVVITETSFEFDKVNNHISPICLEFGNIIHDEHCVVLGWGEEVLKNNIQDSVLHYSNLTEINEDYDAHPSTHWAKTDIDPALFDLGSGLACTRDFVNYYLKGVYVGVLVTGYVEFIKFDLSWISQLFTSQFSEGQFIGGDLGIQTSSESTIAVNGFGNGGNIFSKLQPQVHTSVQINTNSSFGSCPYIAERQFNTIPKGEKLGDSNFKEFPWQVMVLKQSTKSILCGGTLIGANIVLTSASCVANEKPYDIVIKAGEWKLGRDIEPLKYQTRTVYKIQLNPKYKGSTGDHDLAVIVTESEFQYDDVSNHISPLCLEFGNASSLEKCVTLGWGNEAIKYHITDSIMHYANITEFDLGYTLDAENHCAKIDLDPSLVDLGSGLACTFDDVHYHLKGVFTKVRKDGYLEFTRPDFEWISVLFSGNI